MKSDVVPVQVEGVFPTEQQGVAIILGNHEKVFVITVDSYVGRAIDLSMRDQRSERPLTHELIGLIFDALDIEIDRVVINDLRSNTYFARLILKAANEVHQKIIEIDARPSDCLAIALAKKRPIFVSREVWDEVEDASELLEKMRQARREAGTEEGEGGDEPSI